MKWIKCSEQMPKDGKSVLAFGQPWSIYTDHRPDKTEGFSIELCTFDSSEDDGCKFIYNYHCCIQGLDNVEYWMELPEKPE
jgi:hypothetical protein